jgi:hypothetical protein
MTIFVGFFSLSGLFLRQYIAMWYTIFLPDPDLFEAERAPVLFNQEINAYILHHTQF